MLSAIVPSLHGMYRGLEQVIARITKPTHTPVFMNHSNIIRLPNGAKKNQIISTGGLVGCIPTLLYIKNKNLSQEIIMTHYAHGELSLKEHEIDLLERMKDLRKEDIDYAHFVVITPRGRNAFFEEKDALECQRHSIRLQEVVRESLSTQRLDVTPRFYTLGSPGQMPGQVQAYLSEDDKNPSGYKIITLCDDQSPYLFVTE